MIHVKILGIIETSCYVSECDSIQNLLNRLGLSHCRTFYHGKILSTALTFKFFDIKNDDTIFIVDNPDVFIRNVENNVHRNIENRKMIRNETFKKWKIKFKQKFQGSIKDPEALFKTLKARIDPILSHEAAKLCDLHKQRFEANPNSYRKLCSKIQLLEELSVNKGKTYPTIIPDKPLFPSTDFLPLLLTE